MRIIKFRVWDKESKEMIYQDEHTCFHIADGFIGIDFDETKDYEYREWSWMGGLNCVLMQFTGLYDKDGKEIYEGDIVQYGNDKLVVEYCPNSGGWVLDDGYNLHCYFANKCKVIGNIYENPELLEG